MDGDRLRDVARLTSPPDAEPGEARSRFDADAGIVLYNESHPRLRLAGE